MSVQPAGDAHAAVTTYGHRDDHGLAVFNLRHKELSPKAPAGPPPSPVHMADHGFSATT